MRAQNMAPSSFKTAFLLSLAGSALAEFDLSSRQNTPLVTNVTVLPGKWAYMGCYVDIGRTISSATYTNATGMTNEQCIAFCDQGNYLYAGSEYAKECYCGSSIPTQATNASSSDCNMACTGNSTEVCGGPSRLTLFYSGRAPPPAPVVNPGPANWTSLGCYKDNVNGRALSQGVAIPQGSANMTVTRCAQACWSANYVYAGMEYAQECYCGNAIVNGGVSTASSECSSLCKGNSSEYCGAGNRLNMYVLKSFAATARTSTTTTSSTSTSTSVPPVSTTTTSSTTSSSTSTTSSTSTSTTSTSSSSTSTTSTSSSSTSTTSTSSSSTSTTSTSSSTSTTATSVSSTTSSTTTSTSTSTSSSTTSSASSTASPVSNAAAVPQWYSLGCYADNVNGRTFPSGQTGNAPGGSNNMTNANCQAVCFAQQFTYAGTEYYGECWCGTAVINGGGPASDGNAGCNTPCNGNKTEMCGGGNRLTAFAYGIPPGAGSSSSSSSTSSSTSSSSSSIISTTSSTSTTVLSTTSTTSTTSTSSTSSTTSATASPTLQHVPSIGAYNWIGCYTEASQGRALKEAGFTNYTSMTVDGCAAFCTPKYSMFGLEYHGECYCGYALQPGSTLAATTDCNLPCDGNKYQYCGAGNRLDVYQLNATAPTSSSSSSSSASTSITTSAAAAATSGTSTTSTSSGATSIPTNWQYGGCWVDNANGRVMNKQLQDSQSLTNENCIQSCISQGYTVAGMEYAQQCFCDKALNNGPAKAPESDCSSPCTGNKAEKCGAGSRLSVYYTGNLTVNAVPSPNTRVANWTYQGCYSDNVNGKALFWKIQLNNNNTAENCLGLCAQYGYMAGGMEYGQECYCGDADVAAASGSTKQVESSCNDPCTGNATQICGGGNRLSYYTWSGTPLYNWAKPTGNGQGSYQLLIGGLIVPLITTLGTNNKVTFLEKHGTGQKNTTTGAFELDLSQINNFNAAWRQMQGIQTDIFCSAGLTLPDKVGRQINVGGWSGDSTFGIRLYWPDGSPGTTSKNGWQENFKELSLLDGRWYPSALIMTNGSILVVGGEIGSNSAPTPTLEILPRPAGVTSSLYMDWLARTDPNNLYPFLAVLPSGGIFVAYWNEARILDPVTFATVKVLPNIPGSVNNFLAGRTYPLEGTSMLMPQYAPYSDPLTVMICGGSAAGTGQALDNCVSTQPDSDSPQWVLERMPSQRVMSCITALPDGTYLILNGAKQGVAGFGLAEYPNLGAVLYDPSKPVGSRMSIMANTSVARMYHSEAILLPDGRVMVSGSDPQEPPGGNPEEYRVEQFIPPYLLNGATPPSFTIANKDWTYGTTYSFSYTAPAGGAIRVSLMGAVSSTHGNSMGQRTIFPAINCGGGTCTVTAPPNGKICPPGWFQMFVLDGPTPSTSQWIRIGGDPANLGSWPNFSDFSIPGKG